MILRTPRLLLRPVELADVPLWHDMDAQPGVLDHLRTNVPSLEEKTESVRRAMAAAHLHHDYGFFSAFDASQEFVGWLHLRPAGEGDIFNPELGYRLRPEFWGQGLATEGSRALVEYAFGQLGAFSVTAETMTTHSASRRVMEHLGMELEESFDWTRPDLVPGWEQGVVRYRITRDAWFTRTDDPRSQLHELQQAALVRHRLGDPSGATDLDALRAVGMELARVEVDGVRASDELVAHLAELGGIQLEHRVS